MKLEPSADPLAVVQAVQRAGTDVGAHTNAEREDFDLHRVFQQLGLEIPRSVLVNWYRWDEVDEFQTTDLCRLFGDIWYPSSDDIDIADPALRWIVSVAHDGGVSVVRLQDWTALST